MKRPDHPGHDPRKKTTIPHRFLGPPRLDGVPPCDGKASYSTWAAATKAAGRVRVRFGESARLSPYQCRKCHRFHVGNNFLGAS